jgi:hypothetical protein
MSSFSGRDAMRLLDVVVIPLLVAFGAVVIERFLVLA